VKGSQVVRVFVMEKLFKEIGELGIFVMYSVLGALLNGRPPHLKRKMNLLIYNNE
jgi:hypothetical protein